MARVMFDKANVQQRLAALERAVDGLGLSLKSEVGQLKEEIGYIRLLLEDLVDGLRDRRDGSETREETENTYSYKVNVDSI